MRDHQQFDKTVLPNGITVYTYQDAFPISCMEVQLPVGSGHAIAENGFLPGSPHFLEHTQLIRSHSFPGPYQLDRALGLKAGNSNGATHPKATTHWIDTPSGEQNFGIDALIDRVFHPLFAEEDLQVERSVVMNERDQNKFYPGKNKASQYFYKEFINDVYCPLNQIFGTDSDLENMTVDRLSDMHSRITTSDELVALAVGNDDFSYFKEQLAALPTTPTSFEHNITPTTWGRKEYHTAYFDTVAQPRLEVAWIHPRLEYNEYRAVCFMINLLINTTQGPLYHEFREERGWTYGLDATCMLREHSLVAGLSFPVNKLEQVEFIRECLHERIRKAFEDQTLVENEIIRQLGIQVYNYQTAGSIVSSASADILTHGTIKTESDYKEGISAMADPAWRMSILEKYFRPEEMGSVCFMPERRGN
jgi:predicted Zn-dependent peptidase